MMKALYTQFSVGWLVLASLGCSSKQEQTSTYIRNQFQNAPASISKVVYQGVVVYESKVNESLLTKGQDSPTVPVPAGAAYAYALVTFGWQPGSAKPSNYVLVRTKDIIQTPANANSPIVFSEPSHIGKCSGSPLSEAEYTQALNDYFKNDPVQKFSEVSCGNNPPPNGDSGTDASNTDSSTSDTQ